MENFLIGFGFGLLFAVSFGPSFFLIVSASVTRGYLAGLAAAIGISITDISYVSLITMGFSRIFEDSRFTETVTGIGGLILTAFGLAMIARNRRLSKIVETHLIKDLSYFRYLLKGMIVNAFNPYVVLFWIGVVVAMTARFGLSGFQQLLFFAGCLSAILLADVIKSLLASGLKSVVASRLPLMQKIAGLLISAFGVSLLIEYLKVF